MSTLLKVYSGSEVIISFAGQPIMQGRAKDEFCKIERVGDDPISNEVGIDGEVVVSVNKDERHIVTLTYLQTSNVNDILSLYHNIAKNTPGMVGGIHPFSIKDPNGNGLYFEANAIVQKPPDPTFSEKPTTRQWVIFCAHLTRNDGGNTPVSV